MKTEWYAFPVITEYDYIWNVVERTENPKHDKAIAPSQRNSSLLSNSKKMHELLDEVYHCQAYYILPIKMQQELEKLLDEVGRSREDVYAQYET